MLAKARTFTNRFFQEYIPHQYLRNNSSIMNNCPIVMKLAATLLLFFLCKARAEAPSAPSCSSCEPGSCTNASELECPGGTVWDLCGCCEVCAKTVGERCGSGSGACSEDLLCLPDSPYATSQDGTCQGQSVGPVLHVCMEYVLVFNTTRESKFMMLW